MVRIIRCIHHLFYSIIVAVTRPRDMFDVTTPTIVQRTAVLVCILKISVTYHLYELLFVWLRVHGSKILRTNLHKHLVLQHYRGEHAM